jgi:hypothetical protein
MNTTARDKEVYSTDYGARYLNPRTSRWLSTCPAMGGYVPQAPVNDKVREHSRNLPGMGGATVYPSEDKHDFNSGPSLSNE